MYSIEVNGFWYSEGSKCPSCSSEKDRGGRFKLLKRVRPFLKCELCKYSIKSKKTTNSQHKWVAKQDGLSV